MREVFGEILEKFFLIIFELLPFFGYFRQYKCNISESIIVLEARNL